MHTKRGDQTEVDNWPTDCLTDWEWLTYEQVVRDSEIEMLPNQNKDISPGLLQNIIGATVAENTW